jgi:hypothetical protein
LLKVVIAERPLIAGARLDVICPLVLKRQQQQGYTQTRHTALPTDMKEAEGMAFCTE